VPLAAFAGEVVAVDPEQEMLDAIDAPPNLTKVCARAEDVDASWGAFRLTTIGNAFHWMDPGILDRLPTELVALCGSDDHEFHELPLVIAEELLGPRPAVRQPQVRWEEALSASSFPDVERLAVVQERSYDVDDLVGYAFSTSYASPARLGDRRDEYERELRRRAEPRTYVFETVAYLGRRGDQ
jgi:hypothetical protein